MQKPPYDPDALSPDLRALIPQNYHRAPEQAVTPQNFQKSCAQVASLVSPPNSCGLKPGEKAVKKLRKERRRNPLTVRLSDVEREIILAKARTVGCSVNSYVRAAALGSGYRPPCAPELVKVLLAANLELTRQGNNLNQIARQINGGTDHIADAEGVLGVIARSLIQAHRAVMRALASGEMEPEL